MRFLTYRQLASWRDADHSVALLRRDTSTAPDMPSDVRTKVFASVVHAVLPAGDSTGSTTTHFVTGNDVPPDFIGATVMVTHGDTERPRVRLFHDQQTYAPRVVPRKRNTAYWYNLAVDREGLIQNIHDDMFLPTPSELCWCYELIDAYKARFQTTPAAE